MIKTAISPFISSLILLGLNSVILIPPVSARPTELVSQLFYPPASQSPTFMVIGKGKASQKADVAVLEFSLSSSASTDDDNLPLSTDTQDIAIDETTAKKIVSALTAIGVSSTDIQIKSPQGDSSGYSLPFPIPTTDSSNETKILVTVQNPTHPRLQEIITTASNAVNQDESVIISKVGVRYSVNDCQALEREAYKNAIEDAQNRASAIAEALNTRLNPVPSVAEPFYNVFIPEECSTGGNALWGYSTVSYNPNVPIEVQISKDIFLTYSVR